MLHLPEGVNPDWWDLVPAALGAILGAAAGAIPAFMLAIRSSKETLERDRISRMEAQKALALKAFVKLLQITNGQISIRDHIRDMVHAADIPDNEEMTLWQRVMPIGGVSIEPVRFEADEIALLIASKDIELANDMMLLAARAHANDISLVDYGNRRRSLGDEFGAVMEGEIGTTFVSQEQHRRIAPRSIELESIITQISKNYEDDSKLALDVTKRFCAAVQVHFNDKTFLGVHVVSE